MSRAQAIDVINDATTMQSRIDAVLMGVPDEWDYSPDIQWQPGDPLWPHPHSRYDEVLDFSSPARTSSPVFTDDDVSPQTYDDEAGGGGNYVRPMLEIVGLYDHYTGANENGDAQYVMGFGYDPTNDGYSYYVDCDDCQVGVGYDERDCWNCGQELWSQTKNEKNAARQAQQVKLYAATFASSLTNEHSVLRGLMSRISAADESMSASLSWDIWHIEPYSAALNINDELFVRSVEINFGEPTDGLLASLRNSINWRPPDTALILRSIVGRRYGRQQRMEDWVDIQHAIDEFLHKTPELVIPALPRITLHKIRPDLYRPRYERYFESENTHGPQRHQHANRR